MDMHTQTHAVADTQRLLDALRHDTVRASNAPVHLPEIFTLECERGLHFVGGRRHLERELEGIMLVCEDGLTGAAVGGEFQPVLMRRDRERKTHTHTRTHTHTHARTHAYIYVYMYEKTDWEETRQRRRIRRRETDRIATYARDVRA